MRIFTLTLFSCIFSLATITVEAQSDWNQKADKMYANGSKLDSDLTLKEKQFINEAYGDRADELVYKNEDFLKSLKHLLRNRISIVKLAPNSKGKKGQLLSKVPMANDFVIQEETKFSTLEAFNPLKYKMEFFSKGTYMYVIDNTDYVIQITSQFRK